MRSWLSMLSPGLAPQGPLSGPDPPTYPEGLPVRNTRGSNWKQRQSEAWQGSEQRKRSITLEEGKVTPSRPHGPGRLHSLCRSGHHMRAV